RATAIVRVLQNDFGVAPSRMTAGGRSEFVPLVANDTPDNKGTNRRTRIVVLPKLDQFYEMIEEGLKEGETGGSPDGTNGTEEVTPANDAPVEDDK
nr:hypothetical protein [Bacteroidota bacterium]